MKKLLTALIISAMTLSLFGCEQALPRGEITAVTEETTPATQVTTATEMTIPETTVGTTAPPEEPFVPDERLKLLFADEDFKEELSEYIQHNAKWIKVYGDYLIMGYYGPNCGDCAVFNIRTGKKLGEYEGNDFYVYDDHGTERYFASDSLAGTGGGHYRKWEIILRESAVEARLLFNVEIEKDGETWEYIPTYYIGEKEVAKAEYFSALEDFFNGIVQTETEECFLPMLAYDEEISEKQVHDRILQRLGKKPLMTVELTDEIRSRYDKTTVSYRLAERLATDINNSTGGSGWLYGLKRDLDKNKEPFETLDITLADMDGDGYEEAIIVANTSSSFDKYFYIYSLKENRVLLKDSFYWKDYSLYKKDGKVLFSHITSYQFYTAYMYYELTNQEFDYWGKLSDYLYPKYADSRIKEYYYMYESHDNQNPCKRFDGEKEYIYPNGFDAEEAFYRDKEAFEKSMELCTDEYERFHVMNTDFESFDKLVKALKPLDKQEKAVEPLNSLTADGATLSLFKNGDVYDFVCSSDGKTEKVLSVTTGMAECVKHSENGKDFLVVYGFAMGRGQPATVVTLTDGKPQVLSRYSELADDYPKLFYSPDGGILCKRGIGVSIGAENIISCCWDGEKNDFSPYELKEITLGELKALDRNGIVPEPEKAVSIYRRGNGLVHVNYSLVTEIPQGSAGDALRGKTVSRTFVETENGLREYVFEADECYGYFLECFSVTE